MNIKQNFFGHSRLFYVIFMIEIWERFDGYLGGYVVSMMALLTDMTNKLQSPTLYIHSFLKIGRVTLLVAIIMFALGPFKPKLAGFDI